MKGKGEDWRVALYKATPHYVLRVAGGVTVLQVEGMRCVVSLRVSRVSSCVCI